MRLQAAGSVRLQAAWVSTGGARLAADTARPPSPAPAPISLTLALARLAANTASAHLKGTP